MGQKLDKLYTDILSFCSLTPNDDGEIDISYVFDKGDREPVHIENRRLVMPSEEQLRAFHPDKVVIFHPLQEFINRGESEVVKLLRHQLNVRINYTTLAVASALLELIASPAQHKSLTPEQRELLLQVKGGDLTAPARFVEFAVKRFSSATSRFFCNIYLKKAGSFKGQKHARVGIVQFPFYEMFDGSEDLKLKKGDAETFMSILEFIFPGSKDDSEAYNNFSDHRDAPWLDCLLKTSYNLAQRLNELIKLYDPFIDNAQELLFNEDWIDAMDNMEYYRDEIRRIPSQKGNEGTVEKEGEAEKSTIAQRVNPAPSERSLPTELPPARQPAPPPTQYQAVPGYPPQAMYYPQVPGQYPQQMQPIPMAAPGLNYTENGKLDFRSIEASNPMVAAAGAVSTPITEWQASQRNRMMPQQGNMFYQQAMDPRLAPAPSLYQQQGFPGQYPQQMMQAPMVDAWGRPVMDPRMQQPYVHGPIYNSAI